MKLNIDPFLGAIVDHLTAHVNTGVHAFVVSADPTQILPNMILVETSTTPLTESLSWEGGHDRARIEVQVTVISPAHDTTRLVADEVRETLAGKTGRAYTHPLTVEGFRIDTVTSNGDGHADSDGTHQWVERYTITYQ